MLSRSATTSSSLYAVARNLRPNGWTPEPLIPTFAHNLPGSVTRGARSLTSAERTLHALRELILGGDLHPGARLGEVELADRLGVSRTPVREALSRLATEGIVEIQPNRGARVATWSVAELEGVFDLRSAIEPLLTAYAVPHAGPGRHRGARGARRAA